MRTKPTYVDIHIHTSEDPNRLNSNYDKSSLLNNIRKTSGDSPILLSLTDHNTVNKDAYLALSQEDGVNLIIGAELHIRKYDGTKPYHCHILFNKEITPDNIDKINGIFDNLYTNKVVTDNMDDIPSIEKISNAFDDYDYLMLPHGGQSHKTFDKAVESGRQFDTTLERSIYYNQFDGFTSRSNSGLEDTVEYFRKLGINEFINLVTCSDNYAPQKYPEAKSSDAETFMPTWMNATPTFEGLRLSLSESSRLCIGEKSPEQWSEAIEKVSLRNKSVDIDVNMHPGLNVVIGGSSSGKTMFVDMIYRKIANEYGPCVYDDFDIRDVSVVNPSGVVPHYINQNFIVSVLQNENQDIKDISLVCRVFPEDKNTKDSIRKNLQKFQGHLNTLIDSVKNIEQHQDSLRKIPVPTSLIVTGNVKENVFDLIHPSDEEVKSIELTQSDYEQYTENLDTIRTALAKNPLAKNLAKEINKILTELERVYDISNFSSVVIDKIKLSMKAMADKLRSDNSENQTKQAWRTKLILCITQYIKELDIFYKELGILSQFNVSYDTKEVVVQGHRLYIENSFSLTTDTFLDAVNHYLKTGEKINTFSDITPETLFKFHYKGQNPRVNGYDHFSSLIFEKISSLNEKKYKIITKEGINFDELSPGWKSAVILDLILGYDEDSAPIIIDQPEDNLATTYINHDLIKLIKRVKSKKQIILVSHNATIPMLGDAQNVIVCGNNQGKIVIKAAPLEGKIDSKSVVDYIAEITDGGKSSIKKRVKKYNLKSYREDET